MIKKVYKTNRITKTKTVKKTIKKEVISYEKQSVIVGSRDGYCARCGRSFKYGSNFRNPESCPYCICKDCGVSIEYRKREISGYSHSIVDRCYSCWYKWYHKTSYGRGGIGVEVHYNHTKPVKGNIEYKTVEVKNYLDDIVDVDEPYIEEQTILIYPKKQSYNKNNVIFSNELNLFEILSSKVKNISNDMLNKEDGWYGCRDVNFNFLKFYSKPITYNGDHNLWGISKITFNEMIISEKQTLEEFSDVVGFYPNVPAYIQGHPLCMYNNIRKNVVDLVRSVTIFVNLAIDSTADFKQYQARGNLINDLIEEVLSYPSNPNEQIKVNIALIDATYIKGETIIQRINIFHDELMKNRDLITNILTNISFYRVILMDKKIEFIKEKNLSEDWKNGQGDVIDNNNLRTILNLSDTDILVGSIKDVGICGIHYDDDHVNFLESIGLLDESIIDSLETEIDNFTIEEVLKKRNITKLIHVTNKKNLESILKHGLLSLIELENNGIDYEFNDPLRLENKRDAICLSVTDYNNFLFGSFQKRYPKNEYVVLEIDPKILLNEEVEKIFYDYNAASKFSQKSSNMEIMFKDKIKRRAKIKTRLKKEKNEPTSYQAEILYCGRIEPKYIMNYYDLGKIKLA